ncbi:MAG: winged helix-turn-helix domain-containing protein [Vicinamibacterales bacterium]
MTYQFSTFSFAPDSLELWRDGRRVAVEPQPARALALLLSRAGEIVTREELRRALWGEQTHVDYDRGLAYCIAQVRAALNDTAESPRFVQTLPKRGFRFIAPVTPRGGAAPSAVPAPPSAASAPAPGGPDPAAPAVRSATRPWAWIGAAAIAVAALLALLQWPAAATMPIVAVSIFDNETGDPAHDGFVSGLSDVVVAHLTNLAPGRVGIVGNAAPLRQPRNIRNLKTLAATLQADYVVIGQLQRQDDDLRFIVHFIRLRDGVHLSANRFVKPAAKVREFEADVVAEAERVVRQVLDGRIGA